MRTFFAPAIALMNRMRYAAKFGLMGVAVGLVVTVLLITVMGHLRSDIRMAENELQGAQVLRPLNRLAQSMQQHRGLSSGVLNGNEAMKDKRAAKEEEVSKVLAEVDTVLMPAVRASANWAEIRKSWESIRSAGLSWTPKENIQRHTAMIARVLDLMVDTADASELTLDPVFDTYYMMDTVVSKLPSVLEPLGITRARGTGVLTRKELSPQMRIDIASTLAEMETTLRAQQANIDKVVRYAPAMEAALVPANKAFGESAAKTFALVREDILGEKFATPPAEYFALTTALIDQGYKMMFDTLLPEFETQLKARVNAAKRTMYLELGLAVFVGALVLYLALGAYFSVVESVAGYQTGARRLAQGDLTVTFHSEGADELHVAAKDFNDMAGAIRQLIARIQGDVRELHMAAETLAASSEQISTSTHVQSDSASSMAASVEEMTVGVDHIAKNASEAQSSSRQSDEVAESGGRIVEDVVREIQGIADTVNHSAAAVEALGEQSNQISAIVGTIRDIADQTNLLALNAAIEAARAGESGRGFAVVADEVRKLAERTAKSTQEIADMIGAIQNGTATAVASMKHGVDRVAAGVAQAQMAGDAISRVQAQSREVRDAVDEISNALREQSAASTAIAQNVEQIAQMAEENNAAAGNNASTAMHLRQLADNLTREVSSFRV